MAKLLKKEFFYGREEKLDNNKRSLYDETLQVIEESPEEVNQNSIERITTQFINEMTNENQMEKE